MSVWAPVAALVVFILGLLAVELAQSSSALNRFTTWIRGWLNFSPAEPEANTPKGLYVADDLLRTHLITDFHSKHVTKNLEVARSTAQKLCDLFKDGLDPLATPPSFSNSDNAELLEEWKKAVRTLHNIRLKYFQSSDLDPSYMKLDSDRYDLAEKRGVPKPDRRQYVDILVKREAIETQAVELQKLLHAQRNRTWERMSNEVTQKIRNR